MHCHACGSQVPDDVKFCTICGAFFTDEPEDTAPEAPAPVKKPAEEPVVEVEAAGAEDPFTAELDEAAVGASDEQLPQDDPFFIPPVLTAKEAARSAPAEEESDTALDPTSPDFDPRKFAGLELEAFQPLSAVQTQEDPDEEPEEERARKPHREKRGHGGIVALIVALVLVLLGGAAGLLFWLTMPVKEAVAQEDLIQFLGLGSGYTVTEFSLDARETSRLQRQDTLWCSSVIEDASVHVECDHVMNYRLTKEGWQLVAVDELNTENWVRTPLTGASAEEVAAALTDREIRIGETYTYTLTEADAHGAAILDQTTDLAAGTDTVIAEISVVDELVGWTAEVELQLAFLDGWEFRDMTHSEPVVEFKPGMAFEQTEEDFLAVLAANPIPLAQSEDDVTATVVSDGEAVQTASAAQTVKVVKSAVSELTVREPVFDISTNTQTVMMEFDLDKRVAKLHVEAAISYVFDDGWKVDTVTYAPTVTEISLNGEWQGTYTESEGRTPSVTLTIADNEDGSDNNVFAFGPSEANPYFFTGKYYVSDEADTETLAVSLKATDWVLYYNPGGVALVGLEGGFLMIDEAKITDGKTFTITLQRTVVETEVEEAPDESLIARVVETSDPFLDALPEEPVAPEVSDTPDESIAPEVTDTPEETVAPEVTDTPEETVAPEATDAPEETVPTEPALGDPNDPFLGENETPIF